MMSAPYRVLLLFFIGGTLRFDLTVDFAMPIIQSLKQIGNFATGCWLVRFAQNPFSDKCHPFGAVLFHIGERRSTSSVPLSAYCRPAAPC